MESSAKQLAFIIISTFYLKASFWHSRTPYRSRQKANSWGGRQVQSRGVERLNALLPMVVRWADGTDRWTEVDNLTVWEEVATWRRADRCGGDSVLSLFRLRKFEENLDLISVRQLVREQGGRV